jgi:hypothetical protein
VESREARDEAIPVVDGTVVLVSPAGVERELVDPAVAAHRGRPAERAERHRQLQEEIAWPTREGEQRAEAVEA